MDHLLLARGADAVDIDRAFLHDIKSLGRITLPKKVAAFRQDTDGGELRNDGELRRREAGKKLAGTEGGRDRGRSQAGNLRRHPPSQNIPGPDVAQKIQASAAGSGASMSSIVIGSVA